MCGIAGFVTPGGFSEDEGRQLVGRMGSTLVHRGPDDDGIWLDSEAGIAFAHQRLSVVDLSPAGRQPMTSVSGRFVLVMNGEIYNWRDIRKKLDKASRHTIIWRGHSDTEVLLTAIEILGLNEALQKAVGMFAFALWDRTKRTLHLARDRMGEKPLYYGWQEGCFLFASELKALRVHPAFLASISEEAIDIYLRRGYIPGPYSIWEGVYKLSPGTTLEVHDFDPNKCLRPKRYWSLAGAIHKGVENSFNGEDSVAMNVVERSLEQSIERQMLADVDVGAFLSGGIDSSLVVALMQKNARRPVRTFTIGFEDERYDEAPYAKAVARYLGTDHTEIYLSPADSLAVIPKLPAMYDEPFGDSSQVPTHLVSKITKDEVSVALSGDGADELFGGYNRYHHIEKIYKVAKKTPKVARLTISKLLRAMVERSSGGKFVKAADVIGSDPIETMYEHFVDRSNEQLVNGHKERKSLYAFIEALPSLENYVQWMMATDCLTYLPDDILVKVDRASMAVSLETRAPFLDHRLVEMAWSMPLKFKCRNGVGKWVLREILKHYLPCHLIERKKVGFAVPVAKWLRGPLKEWAEGLLQFEGKSNHSLLNREMVSRLWDDHQMERADRSAVLWNILMLQAWRQENRM